ncbi:UDP-glycosyltransferase 92A1 [Arachis stenosperma]|uniref:UDP-glycosyltransferase 92A1 n=1 Tax=Arachis stenosperma TaxID=217475 RepID=UPI0025AC6815|nr:UDP-glycosyltransferase 92A1 [Arachis stenosperma]
MADQKQTIVMFPFMAQGHIIPFLALALQLEKRSNHYRIIIVNTALNINKLRSSLPPHSAVTLHELPFSSTEHGLPPNTENTDTVPYNLVIKLIQASTSLKKPFKNLIQNLRSQRLCIVADIFFGWTATVAKELGVFHVVFSGCGGYGLACYYSLWMNLPHKRVDSREFTLPDFPEARSLHVTQLPTNIAEADGTDPWSVYLREDNFYHWVNSDGLLLNSVRELDAFGFSYFTRILNRPVWSIGPVLLSTGNGSRGKGGGINPELCREWLNKKPSNSVLFVCFGSMNTISASQMMQLGTALERCGKSFVWVVRPPIGFDINSEFRAEEWLPEGFTENVLESGRGLIVHDWAPQVEILSHSAVSAFLSHCGWNSVMESLSEGVPILGWPMAAEQFFNCKLLEEEVGVCVEVARGKKCEVKWEDLMAKIQLVMDESEKGIGMRKKALEIRDLIRDAKKDDGSSVRAMDEFLAAAALSTQHITNGTL